MRRLKTLALVLLSVSACGHIVELELEGGTHPSDDGAADASNPTDSADVGVDGLDATGAPPAVLSTLPALGAINVSVNKKPSVTFNQTMDLTTIKGVNFSLMHGATPIPTGLTFDSPTNTLTFVPATTLGLGMTYTARVTTGVKSLGGLSLAADYTWSFTTGACSQSGISLGLASSFAVLAGSTVTNTGPTSITGDLGLSPGSAVTGFPPGTIVGVTHVADPTAVTAIGDLTTAYNDAAGRVLCPITIAGNIGGQALTPGLYKSTSTLAISAGDLTLDAQGDSDAVFIFQIGTTFTTTAAHKVILSNGAKPANIYWQVGTFATLGTTTDFHGTIMADQAITLASGATLNGRALARIGAVGLDNNVIVKP